MPLKRKPFFSLNYYGSASFRFEPLIYTDIRRYAFPSDLAALLRLLDKLHKSRFHLLDGSSAFGIGDQILYLMRIPYEVVEFHPSHRFPDKAVFIVKCPDMERQSPVSQADLPFSSACCVVPDPPFAISWLQTGFHSNKEEVWAC
jgi:hypothetical protein